MGRPGFVLIEADFGRAPVFSSDARPGPYEIIKNNINEQLSKIMIKIVL